MATKAVAPPKQVALPSDVQRAKDAYEEQLKEVNGLRGILSTTLEQFQKSMYQMMRKRATYKARAKKAGIEVSPTWWERE